MDLVGSACLGTQVQFDEWPRSFHQSRMSPGQLGGSSMMTMKPVSDHGCQESADDLHQVSPQAYLKADIYGKSLAVG